MSPVKCFAVNALQCLCRGQSPAVLERGGKNTCQAVMLSNQAYLQLCSWPGSHSQGQGSTSPVGSALLGTSGCSSGEGIGETFPTSTSHRNTPVSKGKSMGRSCRCFRFAASFHFYSLPGELMKPFNYAKTHTTVCLFIGVWLVGVWFVFCFGFFFCAA